MDTLGLSTISDERDVAERTETIDSAETERDAVVAAKIEAIDTGDILEVMDPNPALVNALQAAIRKGVSHLESFVPYTQRSTVHKKG